MASIYEIEKAIEAILESIQRLNETLGIETEPEPTITPEPDAG